MKNTAFFGCVLFIAVFGACTTSKAVKVTPAPAAPPAMETAVQRIKQNSADIKKYFNLDDKKEIILKAELTEQGEHFEVIYDMKRTEPGNPSDPAGGFLIPFSVESNKSGAVRYDSLLWKPQKDAAGILLTFDDDYMEIWEQNFDLFDEYGARVTFFVQGEYCSFCNAALARGHDVGYHSLNHLNLPKVSREIFDEETLSGIQVFREAGVPLDSFAYPFGLSETWMHEELLKTFRILRGYGVTFRVYDSHTIRKGYISSRALDNILFKKDEDFEAVIDIMLRTVKFIGGDLVLPLTSHNISDTADWGIKPHRLEYLLKAARDLKLNFYIFRDFLETDKL